MVLKTVLLINILVSAIVAGMYWGPWLALTRSLHTFDPKTFLAIVHRLNLNMAPLMTILSPLSLLTGIAVLFLSSQKPVMFYFTLAGWVFFLFALIVTIMIEVPVVKQVVTWTEFTLPNNWEALRDRWSTFHVVRVGAGFIGLALLLAGILFG